MSRLKSNPPNLCRTPIGPSRTGRSFPRVGHGGQPSEWPSSAAVTFGLRRGAASIDARQFDSAGKLLTSFVAEMFIFPHGITVDRDGKDALLTVMGKTEKGIGSEQPPMRWRRTATCCRRTLIVSWTRPEDIGIGRCRRLRAALRTDTRWSF